MRRLSELEKSEIWDRFEAGESQRSISRRLGRSPSSIRTHLLSSGFRRPVPGPEWSSLRLSLTEREEISRGLAVGESMRCIAVSLGRATSTISKEVASNGGRDHYRATTAHRASRHRARRPKPAIGRGVEPVRKDAAVVRNCRDREFSLLVRVALRLRGSSRGSSWRCSSPGSSRSDGPSERLGWRSEVRDHVVGAAGAEPGTSAVNAKPIPRPGRRRAGRSPVEWCRSPNTEQKRRFHRAHWIGTSASKLVSVVGKCLPDGRCG